MSEIHDAEGLGGEHKDSPKNINPPKKEALSRRGMSAMQGINENESSEGQENEWPISRENPNYHFLPKLELLIKEFKNEDPEAVEIILESAGLKFVIVGGVASPESTNTARKDLDIVIDGFDPDLSDEKAIAIGKFANYQNTSHTRSGNSSENIFHVMQVKLQGDQPYIDITPKVLKIIIEA